MIRGQEDQPRHFETPDLERRLPIIPTSSPRAGDARQRTAYLASTLDHHSVVLRRCRGGPAGGSLPDRPTDGLADFEKQLATRA